MPSSQRVKRSPARRAGEGFVGALLLVKTVTMGLLVALLVVAGGWTSWYTAQPAMFGQASGTVRVEKCADGECTGPFTPSSGASGRPGRVSVGELASGSPGEVLDVARVPDTRNVVRTGPAGVLYAWVPLAGALLLASLVVAGGLRMRRAAWVLGVLGAAEMVTAWVFLTF